MIGLSGGLPACSSSNSTTKSTQQSSVTSSVEAPVSFFGFATQNEADANGVIDGIPASASIVIRDPSNPDNGYSYAATAISDGSAVSGTGSASGEAAFVAVSSILPDTDVGSSPTQGTATFNGTYHLTYTDVTSDGSVPSDSSLEIASGSVVLDADFGNDTLDVTTTASTGAALTLTDSGLFAGGSDQLFLTSSYRGVSGLATGVIGADGAVAALGGGSVSNAATTGVYSGGFIAK